MEFLFNFVEQLFDLGVQLRQAGMDGFPDNYQIHFEVTMRKRIS